MSGHGEDQATIGLRWSGEKSDDPQVVGEILSAVGGLLEEVTGAVTGDPKAIKWEIGRIRIVCDGCECERPEQHDDWMKREGLDFCPTCQTDAPESQGGGVKADDCR